MTQKLMLAAALILAGIGVRAFCQDKGAARPELPRIAAFDLRACFDSTQVAKLKEFDRQLAELAEELARKGAESPQEKEKFRRQYLERYNERRLEVYQVVDRVAAEIGRERGYAFVLAADKSTHFQTDDQFGPLSAQMSRRTVVYCDPQVDITPEVLKRLNEALASPRKNY